MGQSGIKKYRDAIEDHYIETRDGMRFSDSVSFLGEKVVDRLQGYCDGQKCARVEYDRSDTSKQTMVTIERAFLLEGMGNVSARPVPLQAFYVGKKPLDEALATGNLVGSTNVLGRDCAVYQFDNVRLVKDPFTFRYTIDKKTGAPLAFARYNRGDNPDSESPGSIWRALRIEIIDDHLIPVESERIIYSKVTPGGIAVNNHSTVQMIAFNKPVDSRRFWPSGVQSSARQYNAITKKAQAPRIVRKVPKAATTAAPVVSDGDPSFRTYDLYSVSFLCFGILAIVSGTILAWKRRS